ncbi:MAG TPA: M20/M25/M40 family metallo-hydrolase [Tepidiformaceae bacterium]|nr:M20/M25/M40 family metallo-hydrolase [Tepidiformaceae bacterium]
MLRALAVDEAVEHLKALVRFDTTNPPGNELPVIEYVARVLRVEGIEAQVFEPAPGRANLVARLRGDGSKGALLLTSHVDVVLAEAARWTYPPFEAVERDGYIWGRGTVDMKGMTAFQLATMVALKRAGATLERDVILLVLADEEAGMTWGSKWMVENQPDLIRAEYALNEVGGFSATVGGMRLFLVGTAEKGICWMRLTAQGDTGHGSLPGGRNAVVAVAEAAARLSRARLGGEVRPSARAFFEEIAAAAGGARGSVVRGLLRDATREVSLRVLERAQPDDARVFRAILRNTATPTGLRAGEKENVVPGSAEAIIDGRILPGTSLEAYMARVRRVVGKGIEVEVLQSGDPGEVAIDSELMAVIREVVAAGDPGAKAVPWLNVGFTDAHHLSKLGVQCYGFYPLVLPPDLRFAGLFHGDDERVPVEGYRRGMGIFMEVVERFAGAGGNV